jgi:hydrogenase/urease accessory protein HupE
MPPQRKQAAISLLISLLLTVTALAHPVPDIPVRSFFPGDGTARITVELDPRCLTSDPAEEPYMLPANLEKLNGEQKAEMLRKADEMVKRSVQFTLEPVGQVQPDFTFSFTGKSGAPLVGAEDAVVMTGEWSTTLAAGLTGWHIRATKEGKLSVVFQNIIRGETHSRLAVLFPGETSFTLDLTTLNASLPGAPSPQSVSASGSAGDGWRTFISYIRQGFIHVVPHGLDHILFVLGVFLLSRSWKPLLAQVTTFTLAHSVTLALATLGYVRLPSHVVEPVIAASIAVVALENIFMPRYSSWRLLVIFAFGLIHGLGFASALSDLALPKASLAAGLVGFNVGVECGQLAVISIAWLVTSWVREPKRYRHWIVIPGSIAIAVTGAWWTVERVMG